MSYFFIKDEFDVNKIDDNFIEISYNNKTTNLVANFYKGNPFPNYNDKENIFDLAEETLKNNFFRIFKKRVGFGKKIIEVGSGTSQLSITLAHATNNLVVALDPTKNSLKLGYEFAKSNNINNCHFVNSDIFLDPINKESFDLVWCSGVLHHTENPYKAFEIISKWIKPEGIIVIGLYNYYGRFFTVVRQKIFKIFGSRTLARKLVAKLDPYLRSNISKAKKNAWFQDQYEHPVESLHTIGEVLNWFDDNNIEFLSSLPTSDFSDENLECMFEKNNRGTVFTRFFSELGMLFTTYGKEGGLFLVIGKKK